MRNLNVKFINILHRALCQRHGYWSLSLRMRLVGVDMVTYIGFLLVWDYVDANFRAQWTNCDRTADWCKKV